MTDDKEPSHSSPLSSQPSIEEGTHSPITETETQSSSAQSQTRRKESSFIKETIQGVYTSVSETATDLPFHGVIASAILLFTGFILLVSLIFASLLTGFAIISFLTGIYLLTLFWNPSQSPTPTTLTQYITYYGTASIFIVTGVQYLILPYLT